MSTLKELLNKHCPDGAEYVLLWSVTIWDKKFNSVDKDKQKTTIKYKYYLADELKQLAAENGDVKILTTNISNLFTLEKLVSDSLNNGEIVCIPEGGNAIVQYYKGKFITGFNRIATSIDVNKLDNKFLYYVLINKLDLISSFYRGAGIKHPDMSKVLDIIIPLPPIEVQKEIVRILDEFTEKTTKLQELLHKETVLRKKQYEYYRDKLLFNDNFDKVNMSNICEIKYGKALKEKDRKNGEVEVYSSGGLIGWHNEYLSKTPSIIIGRKGSAGSVFYTDKSSYCIDTAFYINKSNCNLKFLYYVLLNFELHKHKKTDGVPGINRDYLYNLKIPVPPLEEQERIVNILDKFDALCNDITKGLPAEIEMRKKQYEYYRDKLLTFKEKKK
ncbi:restriction endonuclease subunit S [uncultured Brachyspira sp.]|uniref:restriction endonuclease subunit S n=1 Tax=uncultured Brachyspira sp. TaxID=221953 RepID=UPI002591D563|nr:restriction endonuclease subunit S [uncultured Brachyspira sp.]